MSAKTSVGVSKPTKMPAAEGTYPMPADGWTCFHCGERFTTPGAAALHFGEAPRFDEGWPVPACTMNGGAKPSPGRETGLLMVLRRTETELQALRRANEQLDQEAMLGRGMQDDLERYFGKGCRSAHGAFCYLDSMEGRVQVAEQRLAAILAAVNKHVLQPEYDCPGDAPEFAGFTCPECKENAPTIEDFEHEETCLFSPNFAPWEQKS